MRARFVPAKIYTVKAVGNEEGATPEVVIVTQRMADNVSPTFVAHFSNSV